MEAQPVDQHLAPTHSHLTPLRRGTGQPVLLSSWEGVGVGLEARCAPKVRDNLSPKDRVRGNCESYWRGKRRKQIFGQSRRLPQTTMIIPGLSIFDSLVKLSRE